MPGILLGVEDKSMSKMWSWPSRKLTECGGMKHTYGKSPRNRPSTMSPINEWTGALTASEGATWGGTEARGAGTVVLGG